MDIIINAAKSFVVFLTNLYWGDVEPLSVPYVLLWVKSALLMQGLATISFLLALVSCFVWSRFLGRGMTGKDFLDFAESIGGFSVLGLFVWGLLLAPGPYNVITIWLGVPGLVVWAMMGFSLVQILVSFIIPTEYGMAPSEQLKARPQSQVALTAQASDPLAEYLSRKK